MPDSLKMIVKVGRSSHIRCADIQAYRAITVNEMYVLYKQFTDIHIVVIENVRRQEYQSIKDFISLFLSSDVKNKVYFNLMYEDDSGVTQGISDEIDGENVLSLQGLYRVIFRDFNIEIGTSAEARKKVFQERAEDDNAFDSDFGSLTVESIEESQYSMLQVGSQLPDINSKDDLDGFDRTLIDIAKKAEQELRLKERQESEEASKRAEETRALEAEKRRKEIERQRQLEADRRQAELQEELERARKQAEEKAVALERARKEQEEKDRVLRSRESKLEELSSQASAEIARLEEQLKSQAELHQMELDGVKAQASAEAEIYKKELSHARLSSESQVKELSEQIDGLNQQLSEKSGENTSLQSDLDKCRDQLEQTEDRASRSEAEVAQLKTELKAQFNRLKELNILVKAVEGERNALQERLSAYDATIVLEDPISLSDYKALEDKIKDLNQQLRDAVSSGESVAAVTINSAEVIELRESIKALEEARNQSLEQVASYKARLSESGAKMVNIQGSLEAKNQEIRALKERVDSLSADLALSGDKEAEVASLTEELRVTSDRAAKLGEDLKESRLAVSRLKTDMAKQKHEMDELASRVELEAQARVSIMILLQAAVSEIMRLNALSSSGGTMVDSYKQTIASLEVTNRQLSTSISEYETQIATLRAKEVSALQVETERTRLTQQINQHARTIKVLEDTNRELNASIVEYEDKISEYQLRESGMKQVENERDRYKTLSGKQAQTIHALNDTIQRKDTEIMDMQRQLADTDRRVELSHQFSSGEIDKAKKEVQEWKSRFELVQAQLSAKQAQYDSLVSSSGADESGINALLENHKAIEEVNNTLREKVVALQSELTKVKQESLTAQKTAEAMRVSNQSMRDNMKSMSDLISSDGGAVKKVPTFKPIKYNARGMIIPVFGCGSIGVTTTAVSIATRFASQSKTLIIDFNMATPKLDVWFKSNPYVKTIPGVDPNSFKSTGLGLFVDKGMQFFVNNVDSLVAKVVRTKAGCLDYLSGLYEKPDRVKLSKADISALLDFFGNKYTYIIVDLGIFGVSEDTDLLIKMMTDVAYKSVAITNWDKFDVRPFKLKMQAARLNLSKILWLINMCNSTKLDDLVKKMIAPASYIMMPFVADLYGRRLSYLTAGLTKDKLNLFMEQLLAGDKK